MSQIKRKLMVGLEIHTQLKTSRKLFSNSHNNTSILSTKPNSQTSFFDISLPGTQPKLNKEPLLFALKTAVALNCDINPISSFDRKHYFYGDQPLGYQITQHYNPIAKNGFIKLTSKYDDLPTDKVIRIEQIQIEQDTGRSLYRLDGQSNIDFNRSNIPLIEMVTKPDFTNIEEIRSFIKKFQSMLINLDVCTGELETGSIRVDVNVSVDDHSRIEIKNLPTTSAIINAIRYEFKRQSKIVNDGGRISEIETRGWDGKTTYKLRSKENSIDYRYMPDPELPLIKLNLDDIIPKIKQHLPESIESKLDELMDQQYNLKLRDANILLNNPELLKYYKDLFDKCINNGLENPINWIVHELLGCLNKSEMEFNFQVLKIDKFVELLTAIKSNQITTKNAKLLLMHLINNPIDQSKSILELIKEFDLVAVIIDDDEIFKIIDQVLLANGDVVTQLLKRPKKGKLNYLVGQCMRSSGNNIDPKEFESRLKTKLKLNL